MCWALEQTAHRKGALAEGGQGEEGLGGCNEGKRRCDESVMSENEGGTELRVSGIPKENKGERRCDEPQMRENEGVMRV